MAADYGCGTVPGGFSPPRHGRWVKSSTPHFAQIRYCSISSARLAMPDRIPPRLALLAQDPRVAPMTEYTDIPRIPRRAIDLGTRHVYPHSRHVRSHSRANNPIGTRSLFARGPRQVNASGTGPPRARYAHTEITA
jgi:hypothetical protein